MTAKKTADMRVQEIPVEKLHLSPSETRKTLDQAALKELAESIRTHGVQEALIVRPQGVTGGDGIAYEIVAGQRRHAASKIAGKKTCPCIVRDMPDAEASELRIISNLQREDLPPLEEALAFKALLSVPGATVETVAAKLAKSPSYISRRLKLLDAIEPVRDALKAGAIEVGHALELARLAEAQQLRLLSEMSVGFNYTTPEEDEEGEGFDQADEQGTCKFCGCTEDDACRLEGGVNCSWVNAEQTVCSNPDCVAQYDSEQGETKWTSTPMSVAELRKKIARTTLRVLADAPFPLDEELPPLACTECPKRSGNATLLFDDCAQDTCTDRECFDVKLKAWVKAELQAADDEKRKLLMLSDRYSSNASVIRAYTVVVIPDVKPIVPCEHQEEAIWIDGEKAGHRTMICRDQKCAQHSAQRMYFDDGHGADPAKKKADRKKVLEKLNAAKKYRASLFTAIARAKTLEPKGDVLVELVKYAIGRSDGTLKMKAAELLGWDKSLFHGYGDVADKRLRDHLSSLSAGDAVRAALLFAESSELTVHEFAVNAKPKGLEKLARLFDVDAAAIERGFSKPEKSKGTTSVVPKKGAKKSAKKAAKKGGSK
ncbi:MAG: ParB/RepB/Spo0J family partition protein [Terracidiphilus sp.]|nr:ParB/RepB/Spo0J family partition protein [Terracidiphilus sp.]